MTDPPPDLLVSDFDYDLPPELIAQTPLAERDRSRLLVLDRTSDAIHHSSIQDLPDWLRAGDLLVANNSRVIPARLHALREGTGGRVELLLLHRDDGRIWTALARPARRLHPGDRLVVTDTATEAKPPATLEVLERREEGMVLMRFLDHADDRLEEFGTVPLPPYIRATLSDPERYQTTYAKVPGSAAAPTAGLHITPALRDKLERKGIGWAEVTLHIGLDTFRPVTVERIGDHRIHTEWCTLSDEVACQISATRQAGGRVIALGTTAARTLETLGRVWNEVEPRGTAGPTDIYITPGYTWRIVDGLVTNFHLPRSTLLMMVSALAGRDRVLAAYREAIERRYRFYSFGDAMLIV
jgi:S-adenosylmethionine:tRNA ribosyltransferase-isomerase